MVYGCYDLRENQQERIQFKTSYLSEIISRYFLDVPKINSRNVLGFAF
jgi:hypothetical protein